MVSRALWVVALAAALGAQAEPALPADRAQGAETIARAELEAWLTALTSEELAGRGTGTEGFARAAELVRAHFAELELEPADPELGFLLPVPWIRRAVDVDATSVAITKEGAQVFEFRIGAGLTASGSNSSDLDAPLVVATYDGDRDALSRLDAAGCLVLVLADAPLDGLRTYYGISRAVREAGATLLGVADSEVRFEVPQASSTPQLPNRAVSARGRVPRVFVFDRDDVDAMLAACGVRPGDVGGAAHGLRVPGVTAAATLATREEQAPAYNVAGVLRGADPELRDEYVVIGSHLDHLGARGDTYFPGADDDGSGTAGVLALAQAFVRNPTRPRRSVLFVTFCGEESGLIGSGHFTAKPPIPLEQIAAELQIDMIGRSEESLRTGERAESNRNCLHLIGTRKLSADLHELCVRLNDERAGFELEWDEEDVLYRSDHWNFAREGVPVAFFFTGFHNDYHKPTDTVEKIELDKLQRVVTYVYDVAFELAQGEARPLVDADKWEALRRKGRREPAAPMRRE